MTTKNKHEGLQPLLDTIKRVFYQETGVDPNIQIVTTTEPNEISKAIMINNYRVARATISWSKDYFGGPLEDKDLECLNHLYLSFVCSLCFRQTSSKEYDFWSVEDVIEQLSK